MSDPVTRQEQLLSAIATGGDILSPVTREEMYLAYLAGDTSVVLPEPITRKEQFLYQACLNGGGGGGGTEITDGIVVKARDSDGYATEIDYYNSDGVINSQEFFTFSAKGLFAKTSTINVKNAITSVEGEAFRGSAFTQVNLPDVTDVTGGDNFREMSHVTRILLPKVTSFHDSKFIFYQDNALAFVQLGSIGYALTAIHNTSFSNMTSPASIEVYTDGTYADTLLANIRNGATNATIIIKASEDTTYNDVAYAAGETLVTSTP